jgi:hypothetical protein
MGIGGATMAATAVRRGTVVGMAARWTTRGSFEDTIKWFVPLSFVTWRRDFILLCNSATVLLASWCFGSDELLMFLQTPAERVKAKMKLQLSETGAATFRCYSRCITSIRLL